MATPRWAHHTLLKTSWLHHICYILLNAFWKCPELHSSVVCYLLGTQQTSCSFVSQTRGEINWFVSTASYSVTGSSFSLKEPATVNRDKQRGFSFQVVITQFSSQVLQTMSHACCVICCTYLNPQSNANRTAVVFPCLQGESASLWFSFQDFQDRHTFFLDNFDIQLFCIK